MDKAPWAEVQGAGAETVGVVAPAAVVLVVKVHDQVTEVSVAPVTKAAKVADWFTTNVPPEGLTVTATTFPFAPLPPHPVSNIQAVATASPATFIRFATLIPTVSPKTLRNFAKPKLTVAQYCGLSSPSTLKTFCSP